MKFDWRTEAEDEWNGHEELKSDAPRQRRRFDRRMAVALVLLILPLVLIAYRRLELQAQAAEAQARAGVTATHALLLDAVAAGDEELFLSLLDPDEPTWRNTQTDIFRSRLLLDRAPFGMSYQATASEPVTVTLAPDLNTAQVVYQVAYQVEGTNGISQTVWLQQQASYRRMTEQWRLAPMPESQWGEWQSDEGSGFNVFYPAVERELGARLGRDMRAAWSILCLRMGGCPSGVEVQVRFEHSLNSLPQLSSSIFMEQFRFTLTLPAPTAIGRPVDESGYQALLRGYNRAVASYFIQRWYLPDELAQHDRYRRAVLQSRLVELGLEAWSDSEVGPASVPSAAWPDQDLMTACTGPSGVGSSLFRLAPDQSWWKPELVGETILDLDPLPEQDGVLLQVWEHTGPTVNTAHYLWRPGEEPLVWEGSYDVVMDVVGRGGLVYYRDRWDTQPIVHVTDFSNCRASGCDVTVPDSDYAVWSPDGTRYLARQPDSAIFRLHADDGTAPTVIGDGSRAFWVSDKVYGLITTAEGGSEQYHEQILLFEDGVGTPQTLVGSDALVAALDAEAAGENRLVITDVMAHPSRPGYYVVTTLNGVDFLSSRFPPAADTVFFVVSGPPDDNVRVLAIIPGVAWEPPVRSANGRWLAIVAYNFEEVSSTLFLLDLHRERVTTYETSRLDSERALLGPLMDWSADSQWLALSAEGLIHLIAPDQGLEHIITPIQPGCLGVAWIAAE